jgi:DNA-binding transcriptional ArsR family regulator
MSLCPSATAAGPYRFSESLKSPSGSSRARDARRRREGVRGRTPRVSVALPSVQTYQGNGWSALGDPTRRAIFESIAERPQAVGELASRLPVSRPAVSQHLKVLKDAQLVVDRRAGNRRIYQLDPDGLGALRADLDRFWNQALATYKRVVEQDTREVS